MVTISKRHHQHRRGAASAPSTIARSLRIIWIWCIHSLVASRQLSSAFQSSSAVTFCHGPRKVHSRVFSTDDPSALDKEVQPETETTSEAASFGQSVPYVPQSQGGAESSNGGDPVLSSVGGSGGGSREVELLQQSRARNVAVAIASFAVAIFNYGWQLSHPVTAVEVLASMQRESAPLTAIGNNGKPTVVDFWAPWCENCKVAAPTLQAVEKEYGDRVNFIMVNGDDGRNWPLIQLFGVDAIPHLALLSGEGDVETALIGPMSRNVLRSDIDALLTERGDCKVEVVQPVCHEELPYKMYDAFANRADGRRVNFVER